MFDQWNALRAAEGYKLVDPDGLFAEAEYDLWVIMREDPLELDGDGHGRSRRLARRTGLDEHAIWQRGAAERVPTGLWARPRRPPRPHILPAAIDDEYTLSVCSRV